MSDYSSHNDLFLLEQLSTGDQHAFEAIYHRYWQPMLNAAYKRLSNKQQSEDIVQNVFLRLWNKREKLQVNNLAAYLHTAVRYELLNFVTRNKVDPEFYHHLETILMETDMADSKIRTAELMDFVYAYAETLPFKRKNIFLLYIENRVTNKEIAEMLTISHKTVQNQLVIALNGLKKRIIPVIVALLASSLKQ